MAASVSQVKTDQRPLDAMRAESIAEPLSRCFVMEMEPHMFAPRESREGPGALTPTIP